MATTDLKLDAPGSLRRPGLFGRLARLGFGAACFWLVINLWLARDDLMAGDQLRPMIWNALAIGLFLISYVINIGFSRAWRKFPAIVSAAVFAALAGYGYAASGGFETALLARAAWLWELYLFSHLGGAFLLSGTLATPGCEMRAFHDAFSRLTGIETKEHHCPVGPLTAIDRWDANRRRRADAV